MLRLKKEIKNEWLKEHTMNNKVDLFPTIVMLEVFEFDDVSSSEFDAAIWDAVNSGQKIIPIVVDSFGGQVYSLMRMLDTIAAVKKEGITIITIGKGKQMSCGSVLVSAGSKGYRYMQAQSTMMIHEVSSAGRGKNNEIQSDAVETDRLNTLLLYKLAEFAAKPKKFFVDLVHTVGHADLFLSAKDTVAIELVDHIGEPILNMKITMDIEVLKK